MKNFLCLLLAVLAFNLVSCNDDDKDCPECETCTECAECPECPDCPKPTTDEINELAYANDNDWFKLELKGKIKQITELHYNGTTIDNDGNLLEKGDLYDQWVVEFNNQGFTTGEKHYSLYYFSDVNNTKKVAISNETVYTLNNKNQVTEELRINYQYDSNDPNIDPMVQPYARSTYTYTETQAIGIESSSNDGGVTWTDQYKRVYELNEYGRLIPYSSVTYEPKSTEWKENPSSGIIAKKTKDNKGNITSTLSLSVSETDIYLNYYTEFSYLYY